MKKLISKAIRDFDWDDYGLDEVGEANPEYADHLATKIAEALSRKVDDETPEPPDGTWLIGDPDYDGNSSVFRRDDAEGHNDDRRRHDRHWWDYAASEWIDWPTALSRGANTSKRLREETP